MSRKPAFFPANWWEWPHATIWLTCAATGAFGVLSGYAVYFLLLEEAERPWKFAGALLVAAVLSLIFELLREQIDASAEEGHAGHHRPWSLSRAAVTLAMLAMAEFFVMAWHSTVMVNWQTFAASVGVVMGRHEDVARSAWWELGFLAGLWIFVGAALSAVLARGIQSSSEPLLERAASQSATGAAAGGLVAPLAMLVYSLVLCALRSLYLMLFDYESWKHNLTVLRDSFGRGGGISGILSWALGMILWISELAGGGWWGPPLAVAATVGAIFWCGYNEWWPAMWLLIVALVLLLAAPIMEGTGDIASLVGQAAMIWIVPGAVLGALAPLLYRPAARPAAWATIAFAAAMVLLALTLARLSERWWVLLPAAMLGLTGLALYRAGGGGALSARMEDVWPQMALSTATLICGLTLLVQQAASFAGVYERLHHLNQLPSRLAPLPPRPGAEFGSLELWQQWRTKNPFDFDALNSRQWLLGTLADKPPAGQDAKAWMQGRLQSAHDRALETHLAWEKLRQEIDRFPPLSYSAGEAAGEVRSELAHLAHLPFHEQAERVLEWQQRLREELEPLEAARPELAKFRKGLESLHETPLPTDAVLREVYGGPPPVAVASPLPAAAAQLAPFQKKAPGELVARVREWNESLRRGKNELLAGIDERERRAGQIQQELTELRETELDPLERRLHTTAVQSLELAISSSLGFWTTVGLLAGWSIFHQRRKDQHAAKPAA